MNEKVRKALDSTDSRNLKERYQKNKLTTSELLERLKKFIEVMDDEQTKQ